MCMRPIRNHIIVVPKWVIPNRNHMNDVVEVNRLAPPMLPGSFLQEKEPEYRLHTMWIFTKTTYFWKSTAYIHVIMHYVLSFTPTNVYCNPLCIVSGYKNTSRQDLCLHRCLCAPAFLTLTLNWRASHTQCRHTCHENSLNGWYASIKCSPNLYTESIHRLQHHFHLYHPHKVQNYNRG